MNLEKIVISGAVAVVALATVVGCGSDTKPAESPSAVTTSAAAASDEQQIRDLLAEEEAAFADFDFDRMAELTCTKYRDEARKQADTMIPPITMYPAVEELAGKADELAAGFREKFPDASEASINQLADALSRHDEPAYKDAFIEVMRQSVTITLDKVENIKVTGDTATADITSTMTAGTDPPATDTESNEFVKEDGVWKDCAPPSS